MVVPIFWATLYAAKRAKMCQCFSDVYSKVGLIERLIMMHDKLFQRGRMQGHVTPLYFCK